MTSITACMLVALLGAHLLQVQDPRQPVLVVSRLGLSQQSLTNSWSSHDAQMIHKDESILTMLWVQ